MLTSISFWGLGFVYIALCKKNVAKKWPCGPSTAACLEVSKVLRCPRIMRFRLPQQRPMCAKFLQFFADIISCHQTLRTALATYFALAVVLYGGNIAKKRQRGLSPPGCLEVSKVLRWPRIIRFRLPRQPPICAKNLDFFAEIVSCHHNPRTLESTAPATYFALRCL